MSLLADGDLVLLIDGKDRRYLITLRAGESFHTHHGAIPHDALIGRPEGSEVRSDRGTRLLAWRPALADYVLKMPRGATVVYPKDVGAILVEADVFPGARVLEAGTGSGSLTLALLRAVGPKGIVHSVDVREDFHARAMANIERFASGDPTYGTLDARLGDVYEDHLDLTVDRVVLDLTEPWRSLGNVERCLRPGGILCVYMPTVTQVMRMVESLRPDRWALTKTFETLRRTWNVDGLSVRPDHRMVAHTAFLLTSRRRADEAGDIGEAGEDAS